MAERGRRARVAGALPATLAGVGAAALAIGAGEIMGALIGGGSLIGAVGALVISLQPPGAKDLMVALFGTNDKLALELAVAAGGLLVGALIGLAGGRDRRGAWLGFAGFGVAGLVLLVRDPLIDPVPALVTVGLAVMVAAWAFDRLLRLDPTAQAPVEPSGTRLPRRAFLAVVASFVALGGGLAVLGRLIGGDQVGSGSTGGPVPTVPPPGQTVAPVAPSADFSTQTTGLSPIVVPNDTFYRIDTRLNTPRLDASSWRLRVHGMVEREINLTYAELLARPLVERYVTIACVSNEVGGYLVGNARWTGTSLVDLLDESGVAAGASQVVGRSYDGWTCGFPTAHLDGAGRDAMVVIAMNGEALPPQHGFPARLIVPGLYGYVSATKWLTEIELTTLEGFDAYWVPLGWAKQGPILTQSRIDVPRSSQAVPAGNVTLAGVAWAPTRGISRVELQLDDGPWQPAQLSQPLSDAAWVQWRTEASLQPGLHYAQVRATDGTGTTQPEQRTPPNPDGARGYHRIGFHAK
jgi:DMSO/TMAO reductase YedYZ molybdopterin-dependent catalytic subunit